MSGTRLLPDESLVGGSKLKLGFVSIFYDGNMFFFRSALTNSF